MESHLADSTAPKRFILILIATFAAIAMLLAAAGLYGMLSYLVSERTSEIGIHMALGARHSEVLRVVMGRGFILSVAGLAIGTAASISVRNCYRSSSSTSARTTQQSSPPFR